MKEAPYELAVIGGGLAGLALAIQSARSGYNTILFEKEKYPFHRVCGEYISLESWNFIEELGIPLSDMNLPQIHELLVTAPNGSSIRHHLPLGGFGISRYLLDHSLSKIARSSGAVLMEETKVTDVQYQNSTFYIKSTEGEFQSKVVAGAFGKRSNLDVKLARAFIQRKPDKLNNYIAVKYHVSYPIPESEIALHNFQDGYAGISQIENNIQCLCYLTTAENLRKNENDIRKMEKVVLMRNRYLRDIFTKAKFHYSSPVTISQISFNLKEQVLQHILLLGDAAGMITPLCGNGMSMALHSSKLAFEVIDSFLKNKINQQEFEDKYTRQWKELFATRLKSGRVIQYMFGSPILTNFFITTIRPFPKIVDFLIKRTHGTPF